MDKLHTAIVKLANRCMFISNYCTGSRNYYRGDSLPQFYLDSIQEELRVLQTKQSRLSLILKRNGLKKLIEYIDDSYKDLPTV